MEKVHPEQQNDPPNRSIEDDKLQRSALTIQRAIGRGNKRRLHLGSWAISTHGDDEDGKRKEPNSLPLHRLHALFRLHFIPERNQHHSRTDFFNLKREPGGSAADTWKRILEIEKNCEFGELTAAELLASLFLPVIGKTT